MKNNWTRWSEHTPKK